MTVLSRHVSESFSIEEDGGDQLTSRSGQDHVRVLGRGSNGGDPSRVTSEGSLESERFSHVLYVYREVKWKEEERCDGGVWVDHFDALWGRGGVKTSNQKPATKFRISNRHTTQMHQT